MRQTIKTGSLQIASEKITEQRNRWTKKLSWVTREIRIS